MPDLDDRERLRPMNKRVLDCMSNGAWTTLEDVAAKLGMRNPSTVASRIRDLASRADHPDPLHAWRYERRGTGIKGVYEYRVFLPEQPFELKQAELNFTVDEPIDRFIVG